MLVLAMGGGLRHRSCVSAVGSPVPAGCGLVAFYDPAPGPELMERITARRAGLDEPEEHLAKQLAAGRAERDELPVAEGFLRGE
ncbi:hypothetical protein H8N01_29160 [Streptomyces sp. AC536]|uniref:hypothetical protein n=1 Tax=Streptomyces buecherae TaxID=2763006 RepID=UPI00164EA11F|nr:hypothetical protein [Streptomyces buecherae]MBC3986540.1 hypothetical protein [Streptomyces buecherae]QNJ44803.1 hypothetical protein H7H31_02730 [Streptomyces buecherae]